jgi:hypothetical protein
VGEYLVRAAEELVSTVRSGFEQIGYRDELLLQEYRFADYWDASYPVREIPLAGFAQQPPSYRTAGFGVLIAANGDEHMSNFIALGAPQVFVIDSTASEVRLWKLLGTEGPQLADRIRPEAILSTIRSHREEWGPEGVLRAKSIGPYAKPEQLDIYDFGILPVLEQEVHRRLDSLFAHATATILEALRQHRATEPSDADYRGLFRLMFRLVAAKLLADRGHPGDWSNPDVARVLQDVDDFYFRTSKPEQVLEERDIQQSAWDVIRKGFHLQNLSLEALAQVYETTFVSTETRRTYGTHATPPEIAEFIVGRLPFEDIDDPNQRTVFEPFSGHAPFLTAALGRLRSLLPASTGAEERHRYLVEMLSGIELDSFAREIARYSLILADYPNPNGWQIAEADAFHSLEFTQFLLRSNVVLCNPPFGQFTASERGRYPNLRAANKGVQTLLRVLENPPLMLGFVLPRSFADGSIYRTAREQLANLYGDISITALPDIAFRFSEAETVVVLASARTYEERRWHRVFVSKRDYKLFLQTGRPTWEDVEQLPASQLSMPQLWKNPLAKGLEEQLKDYSRLEHVADIHRGVEYRTPVEEHISDGPKRGFVPGLHRVDDGLEPYFVRAWKYLDADPDVMRTEAYRLPWDRPKVIANAARLSRGPWRIMAAVDERGLLCYQRFHGLWPRDETPIELIAAVLNGPVANVLLSASETTRDNLVRALRAIPLPRLAQEDIDTVCELVRRYQRQAVVQNQLEMEDIAFQDLVVQIDTIVLSGYYLPDWLKSDLMDYIGSTRHPRLESSFVDQLRERYGKLIDKKFSQGLVSSEIREVERINQLLDSAEASYYAPIIDALAKVRADITVGRSIDEE